MSRTDPATRHRQEVSGESEPIRSHSRTTICVGASLYANLPELAVDVIGFEESAGLEIKTYDDRVVIRPKNGQ